MLQGGEDVVMPTLSFPVLFRFPPDGTPVKIIIKDGPVKRDLIQRDVPIDTDFWGSIQTVCGIKHGCFRLKFINGAWIVSIVEIDFERAMIDGFHIDEQLQLHKAAVGYRVFDTPIACEQKVSGSVMVLLSPLTHMFVWSSAQRNTQDVVQGICRANAYNT